jgi:hydroxymethylbilane synthase
VPTRIEKLRKGSGDVVVDATMLAMAGLNRLGLAGEADVILAVEEFLPAAGQGAVGIEMRTGDDEVAEILDAVSDLQTVLCVSAERAALAVLDGSCHTPIGAYARLEDDGMQLQLCVAALDGSEMYEISDRATITDLREAEDFGADLGRRLKEEIPPAVLEQIAR